MTLSIPALGRIPSLLTAVLAGSLAVGIMAASASAQGPDPEPPTLSIEVAIRVPATPVDGAAILARLDSEYLREIAADWYPVAPSMAHGEGPGLRVDPGLLHSEYLREISADWNPVTPEAGPAVDPSLLHSELLREMATDW